MRKILRPLYESLATAATRTWSPYSRLFPVADHSNWVVSHEMKALARIAETLGIRVGAPRLRRFVRDQSIFYGSHFDPLYKAWPEGRNRVGMAYFHGRPGTADMPEFDASFERLRAMHERVERLQVSHSEMRDIVLESGIGAEKVHLIPIGIDLSIFQPVTDERRSAARKKFGVPASAAAIGSFQKDGVGWGEGNDPKLIKGPDVLVKTLRAVHERVPELFVVLSGPARGYVRQGLERASIPYRHVYLPDYREIASLFHTLDGYLVTARQEGGPKAVLESMASGIPLVTTRVGQAMDLVAHGNNAWMVDVEDVAGLAHWVEHVLVSDVAAVVARGLRTAEAHCYTAQVPLWAKLFDGFVEP